MNALRWLCVIHTTLLLADDACEYPRKSIIIKQAPSPEEYYSKDNFVIEESCISSKALKDGEVLLKSLYISVDPYLSGVFRRYPPQTNADSLQISKVMASKSDALKVGDIVRNALHDSKTHSDVLAAHSEWSTYYIRTDDKLFALDLDEAIPTDYYLSTLGLTGATAYYGLLDIGQMKEGESVFVSGAAGATGSVVGQIAKNILNGHVVGTAGSEAKVKWLKNDLKFDHALNYKEYKDNVDELRTSLRQSFPNGIDVYFDNTGGFITEAVWPLLNRRARVVVCGQIANYNRNAPKIDDFLKLLIYQEIRVEGFVVMSMKQERWNAFYKDLVQWTKNEKVVTRHTVVEGFENTVDAFMGLFTGTNIGKMIVKVADVGDD
eukprot:93746_1